MKKNSTQLIYILVLILFDLAYYSPVFVFADLIPIENATYICYFKSVTLITWMDISYKCFLGAFLMFFFSFLLIFTIFSSRNRMRNVQSNQSNQQRRKDIRLAFTCILFNLLYLFFFLPLVLTQYVLTNVQEIVSTFTINLILN